MVRIIKWALAAVVCWLLLPGAALAGADVCARGRPGGDVLPPPDLYSSGGKLEVSLNYDTTVDEAGRTLFCFQTADGKESPTLHVSPGDTIVIKFTNNLPFGTITDDKLAIVADGEEQLAARRISYSANSRLAFQFARLRRFLSRKHLNTDQHNEDAPSPAIRTPNSHETQPRWSA